MRPTLCQTLFNVLNTVVSETNLPPCPRACVISPHLTALRFSLYPFPSPYICTAVFLDTPCFHPLLPVSTSCITNHPKHGDLKQQSFTVNCIFLGMTGLQWTVLSLGLRCGRSQMVAGARVVLKGSLLVCLVGEASCCLDLSRDCWSEHPQASSPCGLCFLTTESAACKGQHPKRELGKIVLPFLT